MTLDYRKDVMNKLVIDIRKKIVLFIFKKFKMFQYFLEIHITYIKGVTFVLESLPFDRKLQFLLNYVFKIDNFSLIYC